MGDEERIVAGEESFYFRFRPVPNGFAGIENGYRSEAVVDSQILRIFSGFPRKNSFVRDVSRDGDKFTPISIYLGERECKCKSKS